MRKFICGFLMLISLVACMGLTSCKAWRTLSSSATYVQQNDTSKTTTTPDNPEGVLCYYTGTMKQALYARSGKENTYIDILSVMRAVSPIGSLYVIDGVHLSPEGGRVIADEILKFLAEKYR